MLATEVFTQIYETNYWGKGSVRYLTFSTIDPAEIFLPHLKNFKYTPITKPKRIDIYEG